MDETVFVGTNPMFDLSDVFWKQNCEIFPATKTFVGMVRDERTVMVGVCPGRLILVEPRAWTGKVAAGGLDVVWTTRRGSTHIAVAVDIPLAELREHRHTFGPRGPAVPTVGSVDSLVNDDIELLEVAKHRRFRLAGLYSNKIERITTALRRAGLEGHPD